MIHKCCPAFYQIRNSKYLITRLDVIIIAAPNLHSYPSALLFIISPTYRLTATTISIKMNSRTTCYKLIKYLLPLIAFALVMEATVTEATLDEQIQQIHELLERRPVIKLNADKFRRFIGSQSVPRNYSFIVMMTALSPQRSCHICRQAHEEFVITATSYKNSPNFNSKKLYFGSVDYDEGSDVFQSLNINSAPCFLYFSEKGNFRKPDELNIQRLGFGADVIARWVQEKTGMSVKIVRPPNMSFPIMMGLLGLTFVAILYMSRNSLGMIFNRNIWALTAVSIVLLMTSGQMWNHIRGAPLMQRGRNQNNYIHGSSSGQFVIETYLVMLVNAGLAIGMVLMTDGLRSGIGTEGKRRKILARAGFFMVVFFFSLLLSIFRQKSYGYPYRLLF